MTTEPAAPSEPTTPSTDVVVVGATIPGLAAARDLAHRGYTVTVLDSAAAPGGSARAHALGDARISMGPHGVVDDGRALTALAGELGLEVVRQAPAPEAIRAPGRTLPMPERTVLGIPATPLANDVIAVIGWSGALRAYLDRLRPVLKIGKYPELRRLVRSRMGPAVAERMLAPVIRARFGAESVPVDAALPALNNAITRTGSLSGGIAALAADAGGDPERVPRDISGGLEGLVDALVLDALDYHARLRLEVAIDTAARDDDGWLLTLDDGEQLRAQAVIYAEVGMQSKTLVSLRVTRASIEQESPLGTVFVSAAEPAVTATHMTDLGAHWPHRRPSDDTVLLLGYASDPHMTDSEYGDLAARDATVLLGAPPDVAACAVMRPSPAAPVPPEGRGIQVLRESDSLSELIAAARRAAVGIRREDFAVPGKPWSAEADADEGPEQAAENESEERP